MRSCLFCLIAIFSFHKPIYAQSDIKAMLKQIALYIVYLEELKKGIDIARDGLTTIGEIKNGEFNLHNLFFSSLKSVNPKVAKYSKVAEIISDQLSIVASFKSLIQRLNSSGSMTVAEMTYIARVYDHISGECIKCLNDLIAVTTDDQLEMTDDERIKRIDGIYADMKDKYAFALHFANGVDKVALIRNRELYEIDLLKTLQ